MLPEETALLHGIGLPCGSQWASGRMGPQLVSDS
jgi:hypothetical protein